MNTKYLYLVATIFLMLSCNGKAKQESQADKQLNEIKQLIEKSAYNSAKLKIDSIHTQFPRLVDKRRIAVAYSDTISRRESARTLAYCDSVLPLKVAEFDSIRNFFRFEKNEKYQENGNYVYKTQIIEQNIDRNYLKTYMDEKANLFLISNVVGTKLKHRSIKLVAGDQFVSTDSAEYKGELHSFTVDGVYYESLTFKNEAENGLTQFVAQNRDGNIKVILTGDRKKEYWLSSNDKKAIAATYHLWIVKKDILQLEHEILKAQTKIGNIKLKYSF